jgi:ribosomal protein S18 acetylase RimI-like enzyme
MNQQIESRLDENGTTIRRASQADFDAVLEVVHDATRRVQEKGYPQWRLYLTDEGMAQVRDAVAGVNGAEVYLVERHGRAIGTFRIQWSDRECWGERGDDGTAGYIHMVAVHRAAKGQALGERMIARAERLIAARGRRFARLDCWCRSPFLTTYYPRLGYLVQQVDGAPKGVMNFQKAVRT